MTCFDEEPEHQPTKEEWEKAMEAKKDDAPVEGKKIRIKQVPDAGPNEAGEWIERVLPPDKGRKENALRLWDDLTALCDPGHHAVKFSFPDINEHVYKRRSLAGGKVFQMDRDETATDRMSRKYMERTSMAVATGSPDFLGPDNGDRRFTVFHGQEMWKHKKSGGRYILLVEGLMEDTLAPVAVYRSVEDGKVWVRPADEFRDRFERLS